MRESTWTAIVKQMERFYGASAAKPVPTVEIDAAATALHVAFDPDYYEFLRRFGAARVGYYAIYGLRPVVSLHADWSVIEQTLRFGSLCLERTLGWYIFSDENGNPIGQSPDHRVWAYYFDADMAFDPIECLAKNFAEFIERKCLELPPETGG